MSVTIDHLQINVSDLQFYRDLFNYLGYTIISDDNQLIAASNGQCTVWVSWVERKYRDFPFHRKTIGLNHLAFRLESRAAINDFHRNFLIERQIGTLYNSPKEFPESAPGYYAVYFEDPDRIKLEVMFRPGV